MLKSEDGQLHGYLDVTDETVKEGSFSRRLGGHGLSNVPSEIRRAHRQQHDAATSTVSRPTPKSETWFASKIWGSSSSRRLMFAFPRAARRRSPKNQRGRGSRDVGGQGAQYWMMSLQGPIRPDRVRRGLSSVAHLRRPCILFLAMTASSPVSAHCHIFRVWHYPKPQKCFPALAPIAPIWVLRTATPDSRVPETSHERINIPLPSLDFEICPDGDDRFQGDLRSCML